MNMRAAVLRDHSLSMPIECVAVDEPRGDEVLVRVVASGICHTELCELRDDLGAFETVKASVLAISCDTRQSLAAWAEQEGFTFPMLTDHWPHGAVAQAYGVFNDQAGCANRATFVIDGDGKVVASFATASLGTPRARADYEAALAQLG